MFVKILDTVYAEIIHQSSIQYLPRWELKARDVVIGPFYSQVEHERYMHQSIGSIDWYSWGYDELLFDQKALVLQGLLFSVPEVNLNSAEALVPWQTAPQENGLLKLTTSQTFNLDRTDVRWMSPAGQALFCLNNEGLNTAQHRLRLHITQDFDLLFANDTFCGWSLSNPARYLVERGEKPMPDDPDQQLVTLLQSYLNLLTEPNIERMEDGDDDIKDDLLLLRHNIMSSANDSIRRNILLASIEDILDNFYGIRG